MFRGYYKRVPPLHKMNYLCQTKRNFGAKYTTTMRTGNVALGDIRCCNKFNARETISL